MRRAQVCAAHRSSARRRRGSTSFRASQKRKKESHSCVSCRSAARFHLADEARARGIEAIELAAGVDLARLVHQALDAGADALAMAGGDGSQAIVAAIAAERGVPYACIPAGTRNHFALDLGVDRDDVVGALDLPV